MVPWKMCCCDSLFISLFFFCLPSSVLGKSHLFLPLLPPHLTDKTTLDQFGTKLADNTTIDCFGEGREKSIQSENKKGGKKWQCSAVNLLPVDSCWINSVWTLAQTLDEILGFELLSAERRRCVFCARILKCYVSIGRTPSVTAFGQEGPASVWSFHSEYFWWTRGPDQMCFIWPDFLGRNTSRVH